MGQVADLIKKLIDNSEDLSSLPQIVAQVEALETTEEGYQTRISKLQEVNRNYLSQIPIPGNEPKEIEEAPPTLEDARQHMINYSQGGKQ